MDRFSLPDICSFITLRFFIFFVELCQFMRDKAAKDNRENHTDSFSDLLTNWETDIRFSRFE